ncbi:MAG: hypothetical protein K1X67_05230 [Fimbriimonadaceae bacterium]|nr:hypothetical protein [Fimbriimonadaceae bacterium]
MRYRTPLIALVGLTSAGWASDWHFQGVAFETGPGQWSRVYGASGDGTTVAGGGTYPGTSEMGSSPFRWRIGEALERLPGLPGALPVGTGYDLSEDGSYVSGVMLSISNGDNGTAVRWAPSGVLNLGVLPAYTGSQGYGISSDGQVVVGWCSRGPTPSEVPFKWAVGSGLVALSFLPGTIYGNAVAASDNGKVHGSLILSSGERAVQWTGGVLEEVGWESAYPSRDGTWLVGNRMGRGTARSASGDTDLGPNLWPRAVSTSGTVVGTYAGSPPHDGTTACVWLPGTLDWHDLQDFLTANGAHVADWWLVLPWGISRGGTTISGYGKNRFGRWEGWVAADLAQLPGRYVAGRAILEGIDAESWVDGTIAFELSGINGTVTRSTCLDSSGNFVLKVPDGWSSFLLSTKPTHWLKRTIQVDASSGNALGQLLNLKNGDSDGDNEVGIGDYALLSAAYNTELGDGSWDPLADLNQDLSVNIADYAILSANYGSVGDD